MVKISTKMIGTKNYINAKTGEIIETQVMETDYCENGLDIHNILMKDFIRAIDIFSNKKTKVCYWVIDNINKDNQLTYSYRDIAEKTGISYSVVAETMKALLDSDFFRKTGKILTVNPNIIFKGSEQRRANILHNYIEQGETGDAEADAETRIRNIQNTINGLNKQIEKLTKSLDVSL